MSQPTMSRHRRRQVIRAVCPKCSAQPGYDCVEGDEFIATLHRERAKARYAGMLDAMGFMRWPEEEVKP